MPSDKSSSAGTKVKSTKKITPTQNDVQQNLSIWSSLKSVLIVLGSVLICFAAARNSITWHFQRFWGASGDFWQELWDKFLDTVGEDPWTLWVRGSGIIALGVYWIFGGIYTLLDITNKPAALRRYKVQPGMNEPVDMKKLKKAIYRILFNQIIMGFPVILFMYWAITKRGYPPFRELPTFHWVLFELAIHILVQEVIFYYSHRLLHNRYLYKSIHKTHHEWKAPIAIIAVYCHPIEHLVSNILPPVVGVVLMGSHVATAWLWFILATITTLNDHSGYHLPFFPSPEFHDFHHLKTNTNFGAIGLLDRLHGTDTSFRSSREYSRHTMMLGFVPAREAFPDPSLNKHKLGKQ